MATYTFRDLTSNIERQSTLRAIRALFLLARYDWESRIVYVPLKIVDEEKGEEYTLSHILAWTTYSHQAGVKVLLPEGV